MSRDPLVLLHGLNGSSRIWAPVRDQLAEHHDVHAPTLPGHRDGPELAAGPCTIQTLADGLERQLDELGVDRAHVAGNSLGGWLALELGRRGRARSVIAFSPAGAWRTSGDRRRLLRLLRRGRRALLRHPDVATRVLRPAPVRRAALRPIMERGDLVPPDAVPDLIADLTGCSAFEPLVDWVRRGGGGFAPAREPFGVPVRIAWAEQDRTIPLLRYGAPMVHAVPGSELVLLPDVGHVPMYDDPDLVVRTILEVTRSSA